MKIGVIADDFTGASDIALTLAEGGMSVAQFIGVPEADAASDLDAGIVALKSRTAPVRQAMEDSLAACRWLVAQGVSQIVFKICSTFDSTADGNIGPVLDALITELEAGPVVVCPAFPENGRSVYQGHLFVEDKLLNESGMQNHPLTPMKDADLRRVLAAQTAHNVGHIPEPVVRRGAGAIADAMPANGLVIVDAITNTDLVQIGSSAYGAKLICGGSGIAIGLPANFGLTATRPPWRKVTGPGVVLSGSCSTATRAQVKAFRATHPSFEISADGAVSGSVKAGAIVDWVLEQQQPPLVFSSAEPAVVADAQDRLGAKETAEAIEALFADLSARLVSKGVKRMVVAGGETSGAVVKGLKAKVLNIGPRLAAGVPVTKLAESGVALALKSGNFGGPSFFAEALTLMEIDQ